MGSCEPSLQECKEDPSKAATNTGASTGLNWMASWLKSSTVEQIRARTAGMSQDGRDKLTAALALVEAEVHGEEEAEVHEEEESHLAAALSSCLQASIRDPQISKQACEKALAWCEESGADCIKDILDADCVDELSKVINVKPEKLRKLFSVCVAGRAPPPGMYDLTTPLGQAESSWGRRESKTLSLVATEPSHGGNRQVPPSQWGLSVGQFNDFLFSCQQNVDRVSEESWDRLRSMKIEEDGKVLKEAEVVNCYQVNDSFIKPLTRGKGSSISLLCNAVEPLDTDIMISHTWAENLVEVHEAINDRAETASRNAGQDASSFVIWFCLLSIYQPGSEPEDPGPTIQEQLAKDPFKCVISSDNLKFMCLVINSRHDPYKRLWCVHELYTALSVEDGLPDGDKRKGGTRLVKDAEGVPHVAFEGFVVAEFSQRAWRTYREQIVGWTCDQARAAGLSSVDWEKRQELWPEYAFWRQRIDCAKAECSLPEDTAMIQKAVECHGGWDRMNDRIARFRRPPAVGE